MAVNSGGQTGIDEAAWRAAKDAKLQTRGWMPPGFLTEDGSRPEYADLYGAVEHPEPGYPPRTHANARDSDVTIWIGPTEDSRGFGCTAQGCRLHGKDLHCIPSAAEVPPRQLAEWFVEANVQCCNFAGPRESSRPGIGLRVEKYLYETFTIYRELMANRSRDGD